MDPSGAPERVDLGPVRWVLLGAGLLAAVAVVWHVDRLRALQAAGPVHSPYDLAACTLPATELVVAVPPGAIPRLPDRPPMMTREEAEERRLGRGKLLVRSEPVLGVELGGDARAYPLRLLDLHEVVNDVVGDVPVAITWHPLSGCARVFARRLADSRLELVSSGVLYDSGLLLADTRQPPSLYSQVLTHAVCGPASARGERLEPLPFVVQRWEDWVAAHPKTQVLAPAPELLRIYKTAPYRSYRGSDELRYPAAPLPPPGLPRKAPVLAVRAGGEWRVYPLSLVAERAGEDGCWPTVQAGVPLELRYWGGHREDDPPLAVATAPGGEPVEAVPCYWFAWYAAHDGAVKLAE